MTATLIDGKAIAEKIRAQTLREAKTLGAEGWMPKPVSISVGEVAGDGGHLDKKRGAGDTNANGPLSHCFCGDDARRER